VRSPSSCPRKWSAPALLPIACHSPGASARHRYPAGKRAIPLHLPRFRIVTVRKNHGPEIVPWNTRTARSLLCEESFQVLNLRGAARRDKGGKGPQGRVLSLLDDGVMTRKKGTVRLREPCRQNATRRTPDPMIFHRFTKPNRYLSSAVITPSSGETEPGLGGPCLLCLSVGGPTKVRTWKLSSRATTSPSGCSRGTILVRVLPDSYDPKTGKVKVGWLASLLDNDPCRSPGRVACDRAAKRG